MDAAVGEVAAAARTGAGSERRLEEFGGKLDDIVQGLAAFLALLGLARHDRDRDAGLPGQALDRLGEAHSLGHHHEVENVAVLARGEVEPHRLLVIDEERRRLLLVEGRKPFPLP